MLTDPAAPPLRAVQPVLVTGSGTLGRAFAAACSARGLAFRLLSRTELDIAEPDAVRDVLADTRPCLVVNAAGYVRVDDAERDSARCRRENLVGPSVLASACADARVALVTFSSDLVFDGARRAPYTERHLVGPLGVYGATKAAAERAVLGRLPSALVIRTAAFFGPEDPYNFVTCALRALADGRPFRAATDLVVSPTYVPDLVQATLDLALDRALVACSSAELGFVAPRPVYSALGSERGLLLPSLDDAVSRYVSERGWIG